MATHQPEKKADLPPRGDRNPDPITDQPGSHPIETGIGAAVAGAAAGMAVGTVAGPIGTAIGAAAGAIAGGLAGKGVGEMIDPTTEDHWLRDNYKTRPYAMDGEGFETHASSYRYGAEAESRYGNQPFDSVSEDLRTGWNPADHGGRTWEQAHGAVRDSYERCCAIRKERAARA